MQSAKPRISKIRPKVKTVRRPAPPPARDSKVSRWGNSLAFRIPQDVVDHLNLTDGGHISVEVRGNSFTVRPLRKKWTEAELLQGVTPDIVGGEVNWGGPIGKEA